MAVVSELESVVSTRGVSGYQDQGVLNARTYLEHSFDSGRRVFGPCTIQTTGICQSRSPTVQKYSPMGKEKHNPALFQPFS